MKVLSVVGNRPQFVKSAPVSIALREAGIDEVVLHTGQHYDRALSQVFFDELGLAEPAYRLPLPPAHPPPPRPPPPPPGRVARGGGGGGGGGAPRLDARLRRHELDARGCAGGRRGR